MFLFAIMMLTFSCEWVSLVMSTMISTDNDHYHPLMSSDTGSWAQIFDSVSEDTQECESNFTHRGICFTVVLSSTSFFVACLFTITISMHPMRPLKDNITIALWTSTDFGHFDPQFYYVPGDHTENIYCECRDSLDSSCMRWKYVFFDSSNWSSYLGRLS